MGVDFSYETGLKARGFTLVCGVDEAGRGPMAGPVCAAAVILPDGLALEGLDDSKKLSEKKREALFEPIKARALAYGIAFASAAEIDRLNILNATFLAMNRAVAALALPPDVLLVDGNTTRGISGYPSFSLIGGDGKSASIAAASILAKVSRDRLMRKLDEQYPQYGFAKHKGYPTKAHREAILQYGPCPQHRLSFGFLKAYREAVR